MIVAGRARGEPGAPIRVRARLAIDGEEVAARDIAEPLVLETEDGDVDVELDPSDIAAVELSGSWREVGATPLGKLFLDHAPGDHVDVEITGGAIFAGDAVAVRGRAAATAAEGGGYREAPETRVTAIRAVEAVVGDSVEAARAALEERLAAQEDESQRYQDELAKMQERAREQAERDEKRRKKRAARKRSSGAPWRKRTIALAVLAAGVAIAGVAWAPRWPGLLPVEPRAMATVLAGFALFELAIWSWAARFDLQLVHEAGRQRDWDKRSFEWPFFLHLIPAGFAVVYSLHRLDWPVYAIAAFPIAHALLWLWRIRGQLRTLRLIAGGRELGDDPDDGAWGVIRGVVELGELECTTVRASKSRSHTYSERTDDGGSRQVTRTIRWDELRYNQSVTDLAVAVGPRTARVETRGAIWAAPAEWQAVNSPTSRRAKQAIGEGDEVAILGRVRHDGDGWKLAATGPESLFVLAGSPLRHALWLLVPVLARLAYVAALALLVNF